MKSLILPLIPIAFISLSSCQEDEFYNSSTENNPTSQMSTTSIEKTTNGLLLERLQSKRANLNNFTYSSDFSTEDFMDNELSQTQLQQPETSTHAISEKQSIEPSNKEDHAASSHPFTSVQNVLQTSYAQNKPSFPKDPELVYVHTQLAPNYIDSLNQIEEVIPEGVFHDLSISYFQPLAEQLCGKAFFAKHSGEIIPVISSILNSRLSPNTDIVLLIDKTGSMEDDIHNVKQGLSVIKDILSTYEGIRVCVASYGDKNYHGDLWYNASPLTDDLEVIEEFIESYSIIGNPDTPESVNDAIVRVTSELNWTPGNDRLMLVIGDAPSQEKPHTDYSMEEVVEHCTAMDVTFNLYPIIISMSGYTPVKDVKEVQAKLYPNPTSSFLKISLEESYGIVEFNIFDQNGKLIMSQSVYGSSTIEIDVNAYPNGVYYVQLEDGNLDHMCVKKFVVQH